ncbi:MAG: CocE/NonD family hydrolase [Mycolicibacterium sp.]|uniref:alpha/beta hydrolase family protein n=1 Tax=Mycolicibacterium sp. TaxID=2320850 RepID=UPI003D09B312
MNTSVVAGRVAGLAVALGLGAAAFNGSGAAWADVDSGAASGSVSESTSSSSTEDPRPQDSESSAESDAGTGDTVGSSDKADEASDIDVSADVDDAEPAEESDETSAPALDEEPVVVSVATPDAADFADDVPATPTDSPAEWAMLASARREISTEPTSIQTAAAVGVEQAVPAGIFSNPITVDPVVPQLVNGVIDGAIVAQSARGYDVTYRVLKQPNFGGKVLLTALATTPNQPLVLSRPARYADSGEFAYLPDRAVVLAGASEQFSVLISEVTPFATFLKGLPVVGTFMPDVIEFLQRVPIVRNLLAPIIGYTLTQDVTVDVGALAPVGTPLAFTVDVHSFDDTRISMNYYPVSGMAEGDPPAPTVLNGPFLGAAGNIAPFNEWELQGLVPGIPTIREAGYNFVSWDPPGEHASRGPRDIVELDSPFFGGRDVRAIIDYLVDGKLVEVDENNDPVIGMIGGSYGGGIQLTTSAVDPRMDVIVPAITWNSLNEALYPFPENAFKTGWANLLIEALELTGAKIPPNIRNAIRVGNLTGWMSQDNQDVLADSGPTVLVNAITAPTLLLQGTVDGLFVLDQSIQNAKLLTNNRIPVNMIWFCGGHGICLDPINPDQADIIRRDTLAWLDHSLKDAPPPEAPNFQWFDQRGDYFSSELLPFEDGFIGGLLTAKSDGGSLALNPRWGGSGPSHDPVVPKAERITVATKASNALNITVEAPLERVQVVGAPEVTFTYSGFGNSRLLYGQIVDDTTGRVLGNLVKAIPITLDGRTHTVTAKLENIVYTMNPGDSVTMQLTSSASPYKLPLWAGWGGINVSDIELTLPTVADGVATP